MKNVHRKGAAFEVEVPNLSLTVGQIVLLEFSTPVRLANYQIKSVVRGAYPGETKMKYVIGVEFFDLSPLFQERLESFIKGLISVMYV